MFEVDLVSALLLVGIAQGAFLAATLLIGAQHHRRANRFLGLCGIGVTAFMIDELLVGSGIYARYPSIAFLIWPAIFLMGPALWWYVRSLLEPNFQFGNKQWMQLLPVVISFLLMLPFYLLPLDLKQPFLDNIPMPLIWQYVLFEVVLFAMIIHVGGYFLYSFYHIYKHRRRRYSYYSYEERTLVDWVYQLAIVLTVCWVIYLPVQAIEGEADDIYFAALALLLMSTLFMITFLGMRRPMLFEERMTADKVIVEERKVVATMTLEETTTTKKYAASSLGQEQSSHIQQRLLAWMEAERPYLAGKLTLPQLAEQLDISANHLSQVINEHLAKNFFEFVNQYRVEEAKRLLLSDPKRTVLDVALDAGFNSKSGFYKAFRQQIGMTPSQYRKSAENSPPITQ